MFGLAAWNRLLKKPQDEKVVLSAHDVLGQKQINAGLKALRLLKLHKHTEALTRENMMDFLYTVGMNPTPDVLHGKLRLLRLHKEETFTWGELAHVWSLLLRDAANEDRILERAFAFFDKDGNGEIDVAELRTTMSELGDLLTEEEIMSFVSIMDVDNDGVIGYQEFLTTLRSEQQPDDSDGMGSGQHPSTIGYGGSKRSSEVEQEDSLPGQAQDADTFEQAPVSSRSTPRMKSSLAS
ncbi:hypothetical protein OEZ85_013953 [Tetradesmus obliquus]|uniref:EF-hand domain-containing protein n=1 Tax=Tetradesmus obliquus TaxID=3088 RepID=A0ABY8U757_TETOB|nr:hypothetical protein OEZ85_013953 [Tetradesmus obliquus]